MVGAWNNVYYFTRCLLEVYVIVGMSNAPPTSLEVYQTCKRTKSVIFFEFVEQWKIGSISEKVSKKLLASINKKFI